jgi:hypothetical protein
MFTLRTELRVAAVLLVVVALTASHHWAYQTGAARAERAIMARATNADGFETRLVERVERARAAVQVESVQVDRWQTRWRTLRDTVRDTVRDSVPYPVYRAVVTACDSLAASCTRAQRAAALFAAASDSARAADRATIASLRAALAACEVSRPRRTTWAAVGGVVGAAAGVASCRVR